MIRTNGEAGGTTWNHWRVARWGLAAALLLTPLVMMQISDGWHWNAGSFVLAGGVIGGAMLLYEAIERAHASWGYRAGAAIAVVTAILTVWTTVVHDGDNGIGFFMVVLAAMTGAFAAWFRAAGMARSMLGAAAMHALLGVAIATAPVTAAIPGEPLRVLIFCGFFAALWLGAAACFHAAARRER